MLGKSGLLGWERGGEGQMEFKVRGKQQPQKQYVLLGCGPEAQNLSQGGVLSFLRVTDFAEGQVPVSF